MTKKDFKIEFKLYRTCNCDCFSQRVEYPHPQDKDPQWNVFRVSCSRCNAPLHIFNTSYEEGGAAFIKESYPSRLDFIDE